MNQQADLIPREPRRMKQPRKDVLREQLALAADEIIRLRQVIETAKTLAGWHDWQNPKPARPWWRRIFRKRT